MTPAIITQTPSIIVDSDEPEPERTLKHQISHYLSACRTHCRVSGELP